MYSTLSAEKAGFGGRQSSTQVSWERVDMVVGSLYNDCWSRGYEGTRVDRRCWPFMSDIPQFLPLVQKYCHTVTLEEFLELMSPQGKFCLPCTPFA